MKRSSPHRSRAWRSGRKEIPARSICLEPCLKDLTTSLGYIVPWYDALHMASGVYEFVEEQDVREARKLINAGGLWNTFIFGFT